MAEYETAYVGFEVWTVNNGTIFDNILVTDDVDYAKAQADRLWKATSEGEKAAKEAWTKAKEGSKAAPAEPEAEAEEEEEDADAPKDEL